MIDTIRVKYPIIPTNEQLKYWIRKETTAPTGKRDFYIYNPVITTAKVMLKYTYYPFGYDGKPMLTLETSLPKLIYGNNFQMLSSIDGTIKNGNINLYDVPNAPKLDLAEGILLRIDPCYNHQVGDAVDDYINAISHLNYPHHKTVIHPGEGVEFRTKHITMKFYDKEHELGMPEAHGLLRQETSILTGKVIQKLLGKRKPTLLDISKEFIVEYLEDDLKKLGLFENSIGTEKTIFKNLCQDHGEFAGVYYYGLHALKMEHSKKRISKQTQTHPRSLDMRLKKIVDSGIPLTITENDKPLPPLTINL